MHDNGRRFWPLQIAVFVLLTVLLLAHATAPDRIHVDGATLGVAGLLTLVALAPWLESVSLPLIGGFHFHRLLNQASETAAAVAQAPTVAPDKETETTHAPGPTGPPRPLFHISQTLRDLIQEDPSLAIAGLQVEIERALRASYDFLASQNGWPIKSRQTLAPIIRQLADAHYLGPEEAELLRQMRQVTASAVHGFPVTPADAQRVFGFAEIINGHNSVRGYSLDFNINDNWLEDGSVCPYEHCIENMPLRTERDGASCPLWGHDCPGGEAFVAACAVAQDWQASEDARLGRK